jgi:hypothetical protein
MVGGVSLISGKSAALARRESLGFALLTASLQDGLA